MEPKEVFCRFLELFAEHALYCGHESFAARAADLLAAALEEGGEHGKSVSHDDGKDVAAGGRVGYCADAGGPSDPGGPAAAAASDPAAPAA